MKYSNKLIIVSNRYNEDIDWIKKTGLPYVICQKDGKNTNMCDTINKGYEVSGYLAYIINNYDNLYQFTAFIHGHEHAWHQKYDLVNLFQTIKLDKPFISINGKFIDDRKNENLRNRIRPFWNEHVKPFLKIDLPNRILHDCCAQFIVSRKIITSIPIKAYKYWLDLILNSKDDKTMARDFEYVWHVIFKQPFVVEKSEHKLNFIN